jgi:hypothetical protein
MVNLIGAIFCSFISDGRLDMINLNVSINGYKLQNHKKLPKSRHNKFIQIKDPN